MKNDVKTVELKGKYKGYCKENEKDLISVEYEVAFAPGTIQRRSIWKFITDHDLVPKGSYPSNAIIIKTILTMLQDKYPFIEEVVEDAGGLEFKIPPCSLTIHKEQEKLIKDLQEDLKILGFSDEEVSAGIHLNVNYDMLGESMLERSETIKKMCQFMYNNVDYMVYMSGRKRGAQILADMHAFLGDVYATKNSEEQFEEFLIHKNLLSDFFLADTKLTSHWSIFNIIAGKKGREALEIRWFGTTLNLIEYYNILEFGYAFINFCKQSPFEELHVEHFTKFVIINGGIYRNLLNKLRNFTKIAEYA